MSLRNERVRKELMRDISDILRKEVPELQYEIEVCSTPMVHTIKK